MAIQRRNRRVVSIALVLVLAGTATACGGEKTSDRSGSPPRMIQIQLQEQSFSGEAGTATLTAEGKQTKVVVDMASPAANAQPAHIHSGTCEKLDSTPAYPLENVDNGKSTTLVDVSLDALLKKPYAINLHRSTKNLKEYVACGNVGENEAPAQTYTTSDEEGDY